MDIEEKAKLYIELERQRNAIDKEINKLREELLPHIKPNGLMTIEMKSIKRMTGERAYFDLSRFKQDYPALYDKYLVRIQQDYLKIVEASKKKSKRVDNLENA